MKKAVLISILLLLGVTVTAQAHGSVGLGVQIGEPTGLTAKFWLDRTSAIDATMGWSLTHNWIDAQAGYLYHFPLSVTTGNLYAYVGIGGKMRVWDSAGDTEGIMIWGRIPVGLDFIFDPVSFYAELDPLIELIPETDFDLGGGLGFRFYF